MGPIVSTHGAPLSLGSNPVAVDLGVTTFSIGNRIIFCVGQNGTSPTILGIATTRSADMVHVGSILIPGQALWEVWTAVITSTGILDLTVTLSAAIGGGGNGFMLLQVANMPTLVLGPLNTNSYSSVDPVALATLTTAKAALIISSAHNDSNYSASTSSMGGGFTRITAESRVLIGYKLSTGAESAAPTANFDSGISEAGESMTIALYEDEIVDDADLSLQDRSDTVAGGGGHGAGAAPFQTAIIGTQIACAGGGTVPTQADLVHSETWWGN